MKRMVLKMLFESSLVITELAVSLCFLSAIRYNKKNIKMCDFYLRECQLSEMIQNAKLFFFIKTVVYKIKPIIYSYSWVVGYTSTQQCGELCIVLPA